jgi:diguanylate cyclase (GGDEF)-like protein
VDPCPELSVDHPPVAFSLQPDLRLLVLAMGLALAASLVSLCIFRHAGTDRGHRRLGWLFLAAASCAFGIWAAHFISLIAHGTEVPVAYDWMLTSASLASVILLTSAGFAIAARGISWQPAMGGAVNGTGMGLMHYLGMYAVVVPGAIAWDVPLVLTSLALGVGLNSAALVAYQRLRGRAALLCAAVLVGLAFFSLHFTAMRAAHVIPDPTLGAIAAGQHHWVLAAVVAGATLLLLVVGVVSMLIDRHTMRENLQTLQELVDTAIEGVVLVREGRIARVNRRLAELAGWGPDGLIGRDIVGTLFDQPLGDGGDSFLRTASGRLAPVKVLQEREEELRSRNLLLDTALEHMSQGLCMYDKDERIVVCNERYATVYGLAPEAVRPGMTRREVIEMRIAKGVWAGASAESYLHQRTTPITSAGHVIQELSDGRTVSLVHVPMPGGGWVCTHEDITERRRAQAKIEHLARHDALTDLPNRFLLREELQEALQRMRSGDGLAVHCLDLDRFKEVNDAIGHVVGDELLQDFAARLHTLTGGGMLVARTGGNEFVIVQNPARAPTDATDLAAKVIEAMAEPFVLGEHFQVVLGASIGIAMAPGDGTEADQLIKHANLALHRAKQEERGHYRFFEKDMDARMRSRHELECNLRSALTDGELELDFQPLLNLKRNEISSFEALLRWRTRAGDVIPPSAFVPLAEETGLIVPMGEWALRQALAEAAKWPRQIRVAVNLSPVQFNSRNLAQVVMSALAASGVEPSRLELEITESLLLQDRDTTLATLHQLRDLGVRIALDDFGTGFSSLNYLRAFPFDKLKIDQCFIAGLAEGNEESLAIVRAVARLGASLGIATTAEGVETQVQMDIARREGFTEVQGFWLGEPKNAATIAEEYDLYRRTTKPRRVASAKAKAKPEAGEPAGAAVDRPKKERRARRVRSA